MSSEAETQVERTAQARDLAVWLTLTAIGLLLCWTAVEWDARLGSASPPFLGRYVVSVTPWLAVAAVIAVTVLTLAARGVFEQLPWRAVLAVGYAGGGCWAFTLTMAMAHGDIPPAATGADSGDPRSWSEPAHPPGPTLLLWALRRAGSCDDGTLGVLLVIVGATATPLVLATVRAVCGEVNARRFLPVLTLAPYGLWSALSPDVLVTVLGAAMALAGVRASERRGWGAVLWGAGSGVLLGLASLFAYAAAWLGLSVICLYFARRRPLLNVLTGIGALIPVLVADAFGFSWVAGLFAAQAEPAAGAQPAHTALWWAVLSLVALFLAAGPPLVASLRKLRNTPGWPFLVGAGAAVAFSVLTGFVRGGAELAWLPFFPWLTIAATAPQRQAGAPPPTPLLLSAVGALTALVLAGVLEPPN